MGTYKAIAVSDQKYVLTKQVNGVTYWLGRTRDAYWQLVNDFTKAWEFVSLGSIENTKDAFGDADLTITPLS